MSTIEVKVPDVGDFSDIPVITVFVKPGDTVAAEDALIELESDKATMEVPSPAAGEVKEVKVSAGDRVSEGSVILLLEEAASGGEKKSDGDEKKQEKQEEKKEDKKEPEKKDAPAKSEAPAASKGEIDEASFATAHASPSVRAFARAARRRPGQDQGHRPQGSHPARGRHRLAQGHRRAARPPRRRQRAGQGSRRSRRSISRNSAASKTSRCRGSRRSPAPSCCAPG